MSIERQQLEATIKTLEAQRPVLGAALVESALQPLRARLASLTADIGAPASDAERSLRQVSILFLDVAESTALSHTLDPEDVHAIMDQALLTF